MPTKAAAAKPATTKTTPADAAACLGCHQPVKAFYDSGKHKGAVVKTLLAAGAVKKCWATCEGAGVEGCNLSRRGGEGDYQV